MNQMKKVNLTFRLFIILFSQSVILYGIQHFTEYTHTKTLGGLITLGVLLLTTFILYFLLIKPIKDLSVSIKAISEGNLNARVENKSLGEVEVLIDSFNKMTEDLHEVVSHLQENITKMKQTSMYIDETALQSVQGQQEVVATFEETLGKIERQHINIEEIQATLQEVSASIEEISSAANRSRSITETAIKSSDSGVRAIETVIVKLHKVNDSTDQLQSIVSKLEKESANINAIVNVITGISEQTNLLALNAAIEAARAGEHGRGFAVVANEVRKLAEESSKSALTISEIVSENINLTKNSVVSIEQLKSDLKESNEIVLQSKQTLAEIKNNSQNIDLNVSTIAENIEQQVKANSELAASLDSISSLSNEIAEKATRSNKVINEQLHLSEQFKKGTNTLEEMTITLENLIKHYKV